MIGRAANVLLLSSILWCIFFLSSDSPQWTEAKQCHEFMFNAQKLIMGIELISMDPSSIVEEIKTKKKCGPNFYEFHNEKFKCQRHGEISQGEVKEIQDGSAKQNIMKSFEEIASYNFGVKFILEPVAGTSTLFLDFPGNTFIKKR